MTVRGMTVRDWLDTRRPAPPAALDAEVRRALGPALGGDVSTVREASLAAAESLLADALAAGCRERAQAIGLLAADALVTYAFEAAADEPASLGERAALAVRRLARLAASSPAGGPA
jgi:hypothetical protein